MIGKSYFAWYKRHLPKLIICKSNKILIISITPQHVQTISDLCSVHQKYGSAQTIPTRM